MTLNPSLALSIQMRDLMRTDLLHTIDENFPYVLLEQFPSSYSGRNKRDRVFNFENTLLTMLITAIGEDKSLKQSVNIFKEIFEWRNKQLKDQTSLQLQSEQLAEEKRTANGVARKRGRPKNYSALLAANKTTEVSDNTAAYSKARTRLNKKIVNQVFDYTTDFKEFNGRQWHGMEVFITDGTYFQMQDSKELKKYQANQGENAYPRGLLQGVVRQGSGQIHAFQIGTPHQSELELAKPLIKKLPAGGLLLADDLYNTYVIFCLIQQAGCHIIVPGKRDRKYRVIENISEGDQIVELQRNDKPAWLTQEEWGSIPRTIKMRRISYPSLENEQEEWVIYTTLVNTTINKVEIILKYATRWDIEITIREIKTIMDLNIARSKTEEMMEKEITVALAAYNMVRKIIAQSVQKTDFSPQEDFIYKRFEVDKNLLVDKKGRIYHHWSPGRYGKTPQKN
jgi:hypothetical protein